jgi:hypothetical protein
MRLLRCELYVRFGSQVKLTLTEERMLNAIRQQREKNYSRAHAPGCH